VAKSTLNSARLKLGRAKDLLDEIERDYRARNEERVARGGEQHQHQVELATDVVLLPDGRMIQQTPWYVIRLPVDPPPPREQWGLLAGDAMHNTRSALDHLACRLVELENNPVTNRTAFPIWGDEPATRRERGRFKEAIRGMSADHRDSVTRLQPYKNPGTAEATRLLTLAALDNLDKHVVLVPINTVISGENLAAPNVTSANPGQIEYRWNPGALAVKGVELFRFRALTDIGQVTDVSYTLPVRPSFGDTRTGLGELGQIRSYVVGIVESFAPEFS
jgi:hypothetical protein